MFQKNSTLRELAFQSLSFRDFIQKDNFSCGFMCAKLLVEALTGFSSLKRTDVKCTQEGTTQTNLIRGLRKRGISCNVKYDLDVDSLIEEFKRGKYIIVYDYDNDHWCIAYDSVSYSKDKYINIYDPQYRNTFYIEERYIDTFKGFGIICSKKIQKKNF